MNRPDPAAPFVNRFGGSDRRGDVPLHKTREVPGHLPDPRWDGPTWAAVPDRDAPERGWMRPLAHALAWLVPAVGMFVWGLRSL